MRSRVAVHRRRVLPVRAPRVPYHRFALRGARFGGSAPSPRVAGCAREWWCPVAACCRMRSRVAVHRRRALPVRAPRVPYHRFALRGARFGGSALSPRVAGCVREWWCAVAACCRCALRGSHTIGWRCAVRASAVTHRRRVLRDACAAGGAPSPSVARRVAAGGAPSPRVARGREAGQALCGFVAFGEAGLHTMVE